MNFGRRKHGCVPRRVKPGRGQGGANDVRARGFVSHRGLPGARAAAPRPCVRPSRSPGSPHSPRVRRSSPISARGRFNDAAPGEVRRAAAWLAIPPPQTSHSSASSPTSARSTRGASSGESAQVAVSAAWAEHGGGAGRAAGARGASEARPGAQAARTRPPRPRSRGLSWHVAAAAWQLSTGYPVPDTGYRIPGIHSAARDTWRSRRPMWRPGRVPGPGPRRRLSGE